MAEQKHKSQADKAAANKKSNNQKKDTKKTSVSVNTGLVDRKVPTRLITSVTFLFLFILLLVVFFKPEGAFVVFIESFVHGLVGRAGFVLSMIGFLYLFIIHAFSGKRPVIMRSVCIGAFILLCGCISHLSLKPHDLSSSIAIVGDLYRGGIDGTTGGLICGSIAMLFRWLFNDVLSYIILIIAAIFTLLGGMQITIPSIIRAVQNRPRPENTEEPEERQEPAAVVVNHIANKRIEHLERQKKLRDEGEKQKLLQDLPKNVKSNPEKVADMIRQIDSDIDTPVSAASESVEYTPALDMPAPAQEVTIESPSKMPPLDINEVLPEEQPAPVKKVKPTKVTAKEADSAAETVSKEIEDAQKSNKPAYSFPPIDLLKLPGTGATDGTMEMRENSRRLNETLASFKIEAHIINVTRGPSVTRYEVELEKGVRLNKLTTAADDIALSLGATGVRIAAVPGKISVVGIEVPNRAVTMVSLREVIDSQEFAKAKSKSSFAVGKDIGGSCIVGNIAKLPHMLIAGTTGSGKSVCMNSIIISLLYKASPEDVKLIMVDPKMVELGIYNGIPHLLIPVVTDPKKAAGSLQWAVSEMMRRYKSMSDAGVRDLESYNGMIESQQMEGTKIPQVVVIIDELADLMLVAAKEVEESICRIAQMGRAAGIHLVIATQRPSADVITGLMKPSP